MNLYNVVRIVGHTVIGGCYVIQNRIHRRR